MTATQTQTGLRPLRDTVIVQFRPPSNTRESGIVLPDTALQVGNEGWVKAKGPGRWQDGVRIPMEVNIGDRVLFRRWNTAVITYNGERLLSMPESEIQCVVDEESDVAFEGVLKS